MPTIRTLEDISLLTESEELECKKAAGQDGQGKLPEDFWKSYSAMANTQGGIILLGVSEKKGVFRLHGIERPEKIRKELADLLNNKKKVSIDLLTRPGAILEVEIEDKVILEITVPRATREQKPVHLTENPFGNTYKRSHEADQELSKEEVQRLLSEQINDSLDNRILPHFDIEDIHAETLRAYRQLHTNLNPGHHWGALSDLEFLKAISAFMRNRQTGESGLTVAGLLMFGKFQSIQEIFPNYLLDYQERPEAKTERRWTDRVTLDGSWSGNLFDFFQKVYPKLVANLKVPFSIKDGLRQDDTPVHEAIREAFANSLVHADYSDRSSVLIVKRPDMFGFRNPGMMRIPPEVAFQGGQGDCRNRLLHAMFSYVKIGERANSGLPNILQHWTGQHWRKPLLEEFSEPNNQTRLELQMLQLFPEHDLELLTMIYGKDFTSLPLTERTGVAVAWREDRITHERLAELCSEHPSDITKALRSLVEKGMLIPEGAGRGTVYRAAHSKSVKPEDVLGSSTDLADSSPALNPSSTGLTSSSPDLDPSSPDLDPTRTADGMLISEHHEYRFIDRLNSLSEEKLQSLYAIAAESRSKKKIPREAMENILIKLCTDQFIVLQCLAEITQRNPKSLRESYLTVLRKSGKLDLAFPDNPNDMRQAYISINS